MDNYFMISEFAKLRGININSLRYYEKLGLLKPAYIDKKTNYRYYSAEQVQVLNKIILCVNLGIPLKEMVQYIDEDGNLQSQKLLERGRSEAQKRIEEMQNNLNFIETSLNDIENNKKYADKKGIYTRTLRERKIITSKYFDKQLLAKDLVFEVSKIYKFALEYDLFPVLPAGQICELDESGNLKYCFFLEIMNTKKSHPQIITLPSGNYSCLQVELNPDINLSKIIEKNWGTENDVSIIVDNVMLEKYSFETRPSELQKLEKSQKGKS